MNLHLLRLFTAVAREGGFSRAAAALQLSQPAVSKGVRDLEAQLGLRLFDRGGPRGITLTEAGTALLHHATAVFEAERAAEEEVAALRGLQRGTLTIGASTSVSTYLLPPLLGAFHHSHPALELRLTSANTQEIADLLRARELDIALVEGPVDDPAIMVRPWREEAMVFIAAPMHPMAAGGVVAPAAFSGELMLIREPGSGTRDVALAALATHGIRPTTLMEVGSTEAIKQFVASGIGVAMVSAHAAADQIELGRLVVIPVGGVDVRRMLSRLSLPGRQPSAAAAAFDRLLDRNQDFISASSVSS